MAKYTMTYVSGATGYGWTQDCDTIEEVESFVDEMRSNYTASITVWDESRKDFIFWKRVLTFVPDIDDMRRVDRDYRTKTKSKKI